MCATTWDYQQYGMCDQQRLRPACAYSLCLCQKSRDMRLPTIWYVRPAKAQTSLAIQPVPLSKEPRHEISNNMVCATSKGSDQPAHTACAFVKRAATWDYQQYGMCDQQRLRPAWPYSLCLCHMSCNMRFPTIWYVRPAKAQTSLRIQPVPMSNEPQHEITNNMVCATSKGSDQPAHTACAYVKWAATWDFQQCGMCDQQRLRPACAYSLCLCQMSRDMRFPTMWYVRPAKAQTSLRICAVWSEPLLVTWIFYDC